MSTKKMHPPAVIHSTGQSGGKGSLLPTVGGGKITRDRQNVENIVPSPKGYSGNGDAQANNHNATNQNSGGKKMSNKASVVSSNSCKTQAGSTMSAMATLNSNRRKNHRLNSPGRKAQDQQQIFNSLKAWNVKFTSSTSSKASALEKREFSPVGSTNAEGGSKNETGRTSTECVTGGGLSSVGSNTSSNSSIISNSIISTTSSLKNKKQSLQMMSSATATSQIVKETSVAGKAQVLKKKEDVESNSSQSTYNVDLKTGDSSAPVILCESVGKIGAGQTATTTVKGDRKLHQPQIMHQQPQQQSHQHNQRQYTNYYNSDDLLITTSGGGEQVYANFNMTDRLMNGNNVSSSGNCGSANETCIAYCYSQNHQHLHHPNHPTHQHAYSNGAHQSYHQNNNYQSHNRNYGRNGQNGQHNGNGNSTNGNRRAWNNNWHNGKHGKHNGKGPGFFRRNHQFYNNNHHTNGNHHYDYQTDHVRNLVYIRGSHDRDQTAPPPVEQENISRSPTPSPQSVSPAIDVVETSQVGSNGNTPMHDEKSDSGIEEVVRNLKKSGVVPSSSSSSSSMVSIPSTDSSAVSSSVSQNLSLDLNCINGQGYESDSSHSSSYNSHVYRHRKYANGGHVYRSSSSTSSGVSSTATYPPLNSSSSTDAPTTSSSQVTDFFLRSQSYHGSHQNLESTSGNASPNLPDSPIGTPRSMVANQPLPMFSELFTGKHRSHQQQQQQQHQTINYICNNSLELHTAASGNSPLSTSNHNTSSSNHSYSGAPPSTVPPNETYSMQSGHPKRHYSGRQSPSTSCSSSQKAPLSTGLSSHTAETASSQHQQHQSSQNEQLQLSPILHINRKNQTAWGQNRSDTTMPISTASSGIVPDVVMQAAPTALPPPTAHPMSFPNDTSNIHTPADRFLARSHQVELRVPSQEIAPKGCKWASLSTAIWDKFAAAQQTEQKFIQKIHLWRYLFMCIRKVFPRLGLYLVGSTMSGFASDSSDVDMCLISRANVVPYDMRGEALYQLGQIKNYFMNIPIYFEEFSLIQAKVPILRFRDRANLIVVDLNYNNCVGIRNTHLLHCYSQMDWRLRPLVLVVKLWAQHHNINDAKNMTISSYSLVLMVIHFLQFGVGPPILPCLHAMFPDKFARMSDISNLDMMEEMEPYKNDNNMSLGELFLQFLEYYANFDYAQYAISVRTGSVIPIETARLVRSYRNDPHHWRQLCIEEPFELTNTARSVFDADIFEQIKSVFSVCWKRLKETNDLSSVFECDPLFIPVASTLSLTS
ncbi:poly(A) RNA polymerase gld-2 homolog B-like isoform X2 [Toxorhynchites rutilus septentrionalis]|uniref:poly(A) RNA polymerase gld-2 homolog B-like isoform X2 n=1 Tax=Toxorhynchites rutilus septentrionalis TaxID=329112 RepID=UPI0024790E0A|nr:poly(A) RNA polymerase gld-2 homolog B-like isoform X2 [Toxorhynchites rutilus septentrionalis]